VYVLDQFGITGPEGYLYTSAAGCLDVPGIDDVADYAETLVIIQLLFIE
jgi:myosin-1